MKRNGLVGYGVGLMRRISEVQILFSLLYKRKSDFLQRIYSWVAQSCWLYSGRTPTANNSEWNPIHDFSTGRVNGATDYGRGPIRVVVSNLQCHWPQVAMELGAGVNREVAGAPQLKKPAYYYKSRGCGVV